MNLPQLPLDKANHFIYGSIIGIVLFAIALQFGLPAVISAWASLIGTTIIGFLKEGKDAWVNYRATGNLFSGPHGVEPADVVATAAGALPIWAAVLLSSLF